MDGLRPGLLGHRLTVRAKRVLEAVGLVGVLGTFFLLKIPGIRPSTTDENIYFYMADRFADGVLPYRDFFFAHPPLHWLPGLPVHGLLGFSPAAARVIPVGATLVSALAIFLTAKRHVGRVGAVAAVFALLTAFSLLRASSHWTGINLALMWSSLGMLFVLRRRCLTAGIMFDLGVCTGNYVLPGAVMAGLLAFFVSTRYRLPMLGALAPLGGLALAQLARRAARGERRRALLIFALALGAGIILLPGLLGP